MGKRCVVLGCKHYCKGGGDDFAFYVIPQDLARRKRWLEILEIDENLINKHARICGRHFDSKYAKCRRLSADVLPVASVSTSPKPIVLDSPNEPATFVRRNYPLFASPRRKSSQVGQVFPLSFGLCIFLNTFMRKWNS